MKISIIFISCLSVFLNLLSAQQSKNTCCTCLGDFCFHSKYIFETEIVKKYGMGVFLHKNIGGVVNTRSHVYYDPIQKLWIRFDADDNEHDGNYVVEWIYVSVVPFSKDTVLPINQFSPFVTDKQIKVGYKESEVLKVYGTPYRVDDAVEREMKRSSYKNDPGYGSVYGSKVFVYISESENFHVLFLIHIEKGIVRSFTLSCSE